MPWSLQLIIAVCTITLYIVFKELCSSSDHLARLLYYSLGVGMFSALFLIFWTFQYSIHHTILYWRIVELFK